MRDPVLFFCSGCCSSRSDEGQGPGDGDKPRSGEFPERLGDNGGQGQGRDCNSPLPHGPVDLDRHQDRLPRHVNIMVSDKPTSRMQHALHDHKHRTLSDKKIEWNQMLMGAEHARAPESSAATAPTRGSASASASAPATPAAGSAWMSRGGVKQGARADCCS